VPPPEARERLLVAREPPGVQAPLEPGTPLAAQALVQARPLRALVSPAPSGGWSSLGRGRSRQQEPSLQRARSYAFLKSPVKYAEIIQKIQGKSRTGAAGDRRRSNPEDRSALLAMTEKRRITLPGWRRQVHPERVPNPSPQIGVLKTTEKQNRTAISAMRNQSRRFACRSNFTPSRA
jgi:hypothetical protein